MTSTSPAWFKAGLTVTYSMEYIIGVAVSLIVEGYKKYSKTDPYMTLIAIFILSVSSAVVYVYLSDSGLWMSVVTILTTAGAFHNFIIRRINY